MTTATDLIYRLKDSLRFSLFEDGGVVFDLNNRRCYEINRSAALIIGYLNEYQTLADIIEAVCLGVNPPWGAVEKDIIEFVDNLIRRGWIDVQE